MSEILNKSALEAALEKVSNEFLKEVVHTAIHAYISALPKDDPLYETLELSNGPLHMDITKHKVFKDGQEVNLTNKEFDVLRCLLTHKGKLVTFARLHRDCWPRHNTEQVTHNIRVTISGIRKKIGSHFIATDNGIGYMMEEARHVISPINTGIAC